MNATAPQTVKAPKTKVVRLTDGDTNCVFFLRGDTVKMTMTDSFGVVSTENYSLEEGRKAYKAVRKFNPTIKEGFTPLVRALKSFKVLDAEILQTIDNKNREEMGDDAWAEHSCAIWGDFYDCGFHEVYYRAGELSKVGAKVL